MKTGRVTVLDDDDGGHIAKQSFVMNKICSQGYPKLKVDFSGWASIQENDEAAKEIIAAIGMRNKYMGFLDHQYKPILFTNDDSYNAHNYVRHRSNTVGNQARGCYEARVRRKKPEPPLYDEKAEEKWEALQEKSRGGKHTSKWEEIQVEIEEGSDDDEEDEAEEEQEYHRRRFVEEGGFESERVKRDIDVFISTIPSGEEFLRDYDSIVNICSHGPVPGFAAKRLKVLDYKYSFHRLLNAKRESYSMKLLPKDRVSVVTVDTHVHLAAAMTDKQLLNFIKKKIKEEPNEIVMEKNGVKKTLMDVFTDLKINPNHISAHLLDVRADSSTFQRFDNFNSLYNPFGESELRTIFLKTGNYIKGKYFAELTKEIFAMNEKNNKKTEYRISIYGRSIKEWHDLAQWIKAYDVRSPSNRWLIQVPRIYSGFRSSNLVKSFKQYLDNIFQPLFDVTKNPECDPDLDAFLADVSGFDSVDDESKIDVPIPKGIVSPEEWTSETNPPYLYYMYHMYRNIAILNRYRYYRGLPPLTFRPHSGESGSEKHLAATFLVANEINHGINLEKIQTLEYLYYLCKIGLCVSPLSNNSLFVDYRLNPFQLLFNRGLSVSLSTDDPLQFHFTETPLTEEYAIASKFWSLSETDIAEISHNSVIHSGFSAAEKAKWLGHDYMNSNDSRKTNIPDIRYQFRAECYKDERDILIGLSTRESLQSLSFSPSPPLPASDIFTPLPTPSPSTYAQGPLQRSLGGTPLSNSFAHSPPLDPLNESDVVAALTKKLGYARIKISSGPRDTLDPELYEAIPMIRRAIQLRNKYVATWFFRENEDPGAMFVSSSVASPLSSSASPVPVAPILASLTTSTTPPSGISISSLLTSTITLQQQQLEGSEKVECRISSDACGDDEGKGYEFSMVDGVFEVYPSSDALCSVDGTELATIRCTECNAEFCVECYRVIHRHPKKRTHRIVEHPPQRAVYEPIGFEEYVNDYKTIANICANGPCRTACWTRNHIIQEKYHMHKMLNEEQESLEAKMTSSDFYRVTKVDTHVHVNRAMSASQLLHYIRDKYIHEGDRVVWDEFRGERDVTLRRTFDLLGLHGERALNLDGLSVNADESSYKRFDNWVSKYNPFGKETLRKLFLSVEGVYLADILKSIIFAGEAPAVANTNPIKLENRISINETNPAGFDILAKWVMRHGLNAYRSNRWVIQLPRILPQQINSGLVRSFGEVLRNIFQPLFEVTRDPSSHPELHEFLKNVSGFDTVGDESETEYGLSAGLSRPDEWEMNVNPPYAYWLYYLNANIQSLNAFRRLRGLNVFDFRPHCGESGDPLHLVAGYLTARNISHGTTLRTNPTLSYLYYINQIGITASPLGESSVNIDYKDNPFPTFFKRGLNITLATDNPLLLHMTEEPLMEEYATASQMWKLSPTDLCEIARNSVIISGFDVADKEEWIGKSFWSNLNSDYISPIRLSFRRDVLEDERKLFSKKYV